RERAFQIYGLESRRPVIERRAIGLRRFTVCPQRRTAAVDRYEFEPANPGPIAPLFAVGANDKLLPVGCLDRRRVFENQRRHTPLPVAQQETRHGVGRPNGSSAGLKACTTRGLGSWSWRRRATASSTSALRSSGALCSKGSIRRDRCQGTEPCGRARGAS